MNDTYYEFGTAADRWDRAQMFFEAKEYLTAARILGGLVEEVPEQVAPRLLLARAYYHWPVSARPRPNCGPCWSATPSSTTRG